MHKIVSRCSFVIWLSMELVQKEYLKGAILQHKIFIRFIYQFYQVFKSTAGMCNMVEYGRFMTCDAPQPRPDSVVRSYYNDKPNNHY